MADAGKSAKGSKAPAGQRRNFFATMSSETIKSLKRAAIEDDTTASEILEQAARDWLERRKHKAP